MRTQILTSRDAQASLQPELIEHPASVAEPWFALVVKLRHERAAEQILANKGFETFLPCYSPRHGYGSRRREYQLPLFPGYLFCRFDPQTQFAVLNTPSIIQVTGAGRRPFPVDEREVESLRIAVASHLTLVPCPYLHTGQKVRVGQGLLEGAEGIIVKLKDSTRLVLSITTLQRSVIVELGSANLGACQEITLPTGDRLLTRAAK